MIKKEHFEYLYNEYYTGLCAYAMRFVLSRDVAEDIVQDVFYSLWCNRMKIEFELSGKSFLYLSVKNKSLDYIRHHKIRERYEEKLLNEGVVSENFTWEQFVERDMTFFIEKALNNLSCELREVLVMNKVDGKTAAEIAAEKGISIRTIEGQIARAVKKVKENLKEVKHLLLVVFKNICWVRKKK